MDGYSNKLGKILKERIHNSFYSSDVSGSLKDSLNFLLRMGTLQELTGHDGCVNSVRWNSEGSLLLTGSDDRMLNIYKYPGYKLRTIIPSGHKSNIFKSRFLPFSKDEKICSCSNDGAVIFNDLTQPRNFGKYVFNCHKGIVYDVLVHNQDPFSVTSCGEDGKVRYFDLRVKSKCACNYCSRFVMINLEESTNSLAINPYNINEIAVGVADGTIRVFDRRACFGYKNRMLKTYPIDMETGQSDGLIYCYRYNQNRDTGDPTNSNRITSLTYNHNGREILASYSPDTIVRFATTPKRNPSADDIKFIRRCLHNYTHLMPGDLKNVNINSKTLKLVKTYQSRLKKESNASGSSAHNCREYVSQDRDYHQSLYDRNSDYRNTNFRRVNEAASYEFGSTASPGDQSHQIFINDREFSTETIPLLNRHRNFFNSNIGRLFNNTDPPQRNESVQDYDDNELLFGDASCPLRRMKRFLTGLNDESCGVNFDLQANNFYNIYDESVVEQPPAYDRLRCYLDNIFIPDYVKFYRGHGNIRTMIKECNYYGSKYIISGSDCGNVFFWDKDTCEVVNILKADENIVNSVQPHPDEPIIACSGIDSTTKIIGPKFATPKRDENMSEVIESNSFVGGRQVYRAPRHDFTAEMILQMLIAMENSAASNSPDDSILRLHRVDQNGNIFDEDGNLLNARTSPIISYNRLDETNSRNQMAAEYTNLEFEFSSNDFGSFSDGDSQEDAFAMDYSD